MKKIIVIFIFSIMFIITGCSCRPNYYSKAEVKSFVKETFGDEYKLKKVNTFKDNTEEKNKVYEYIFVNDEGFEFSVYASTSHISIDATKTNLYGKNLSTNYLTVVMDSKSNGLKKILNSLSFKTEVKSQSNYIFFYLNDLNNPNEVADAIVKIDKLLDLNYKYNSNYIGLIRVEIYYSPTSNIDDKKFIASINISCRDENRLTIDSVEERLNSAFERHINNGKEN